MKKHLSPLLLTFLICSCSQTEQYNPISAIEADISILASDSLAGREVGTEGEKMAADYIAAELKATGVQPKGTNGFYQSFFVKDADNPHAQPSEETGEDGITGYNVVGMIDNPGDELVVIGAHYDHLGMGDFSSLYRGEKAIHNGADDNASGIAAMLHLARVLSDQELNRDILFIGFSGEEKGLWGSNYFTKNPTVDLTKVNFMINMDMVGRLDESKGLAVNGTGTSPIWNWLLDEVNADSLKLIKGESGVGPSDHTSFYLQDIPVLHFFTGQHEDYHKPSDDPEKINEEGILKVASIIERMIVLMDDDEKIAFTKTKDESDNPRFTVTLGVVPDYMFDGEGMRIDGVSEDKPAIKAGILKGDVVVQLGDSTVTDMMSYMRALSTFEKGDKTTVLVDRGGEKLSFEIEF
ncbi:PDZ domain-containing protein [Ekhidna lutea]|uniref:PDZ domain-containing protein n=1 Tax=Ekhidna lutea TaxID=447679 RepID=A0A239L5T8_EKHLU|nr:M20/M25/M40 family metallo-hydrolase [Ekhidna lutea]SNT25670.1 PDZ domain-containing protein [Ekhidna lutea]